MKAVSSLLAIRADAWSQFVACRSFLESPIVG